MRERTQLPPNLHFFLNQAPTDSLLIIETKVTPKDFHSGDRKVRQKCLIDFSIDDISEIRIQVKGKQRLKWRP